MPEPPTRATQLARHLLDIEAVLLQPSDPFTWSSGLRSPIYCDNRLTMAHPPVRRLIRDGFAAALGEQHLTPDVIVGTATAGIPHAAWLAEQLDLPMAYVRSSAKGHGRQNQIEGRIPAGASVVIIEDLVSTGGSALNAVEAVREAGATVEAVLAIFTYELDVAAERFETANVPLITLTSYRILLDVAEARGDLSAADHEALHAWRRDPEAWSAAHVP
jgi:orotate phosphoribosyltransferase